jgi:putative alpha-1,2-mannosidase
MFQKFRKDDVQEATEQVRAASAAAFGAWDTFPSPPTPFCVVVLSPENDEMCSGHLVSPEYIASSFAILGLGPHQKFDIIGTRWPLLHTISSPGARAFRV